MMLAFVGITFSQTIVRSGFVKKIDTNQYKEILLSEEEKMDLKSLINKKFKSKFHLFLIPMMQMILMFSLGIFVFF